jgi:hypothetical protein
MRELAVHGQAPTPDWDSDAPRDCRKRPVHVTVVFSSTKWRFDGV